MKKTYLLIVFLIVLLTGCKTEETRYNRTESTQSTAYETIENSITREDVTTQEDATTQEETSTQEKIKQEDNERDEYYSTLVGEAVAEGRKIVYLTFDDGSGTLTPTALDILDEYNVKATFFVVGAYSPSEEYARTEYNDIINRGHTLGIHSFTHSRADIYSSLEAFSADCDIMMEYVINLTGYTPFLWRFPGGSATMYADSRMQTEYIPYIENKGLTYYDWNVSSGDGNGTITRDEIYNNVINGVKNKDISVVLMHDGKGHEETVAALPNILNTLINELDCLVVPITESTIPVQSQLN